AARAVGGGSQIHEVRCSEWTARRHGGARVRAADRCCGEACEKGSRVSGPRGAQAEAEGRAARGKTDGPDVWRSPAEGTAEGASGPQARAAAIVPGTAAPCEVCPRARHAAVLRFLRRPPTELADGFGREAALPAVGRRPTTGFTPVLRWVPGSVPRVRARLGGARCGAPREEARRPTGQGQRRRRSARAQTEVRR